jgi:hypothetical protein
MRPLLHNAKGELYRWQWSTTFPLSHMMETVPIWANRTDCQIGTVNPANPGLVDIIGGINDDTTIYSASDLYDDADEPKGT